MSSGGWDFLALKHSEGSVLIVGVGFVCISAAVWRVKKHIVWLQTGLLAIVGFSVMVLENVMSRGNSVSVA